MLSWPHGTEQPVTPVLVCEHTVLVMGYVLLLSVWYRARVAAPPPPKFPWEPQEADSFISLKAAFSEASLVLQLMDLLSFRSIELGSSEATSTKTGAPANAPRSKGSKPKLNLSLKFGSESQIQEVVHENRSGHCFFLKSSSAKNNALCYSYK